MNYGFCRRPWLNNTQSREVKKDMSTSGLYMHVHTCAGTPVPIHMHPHPCKRTHTRTTHIRTATVKVHASHRYCQLSFCVYNSLLANPKHIILSPYSLVLDVVNFILVSLFDFSLHFSVLWGIGFFLHLVGKHWLGFPAKPPPTSVLQTGTGAAASASMTDLSPSGFCVLCWFKPIKKMDFKQMPFEKVTDEKERMAMHVRACQGCLISPAFRSAHPVGPWPSCTLCSAKRVESVVTPGKWGGTHMFS